MFRLLTILLLLPTLSFAQLQSYPVESLETLQKEKPKPVLMMVMTKWCTFCKAMENTTFRNKDIVSVLNKHYYFVKFDAEQQGEVTIKGKTFRYVPAGKNTGSHELANFFSDQENLGTYPKLIFLDQNLEKTYEINGFISAKELKQIL